MSCYSELIDFMCGESVISTHSHFLPKGGANGFGIKELLSNSYCRGEWCGTAEGETAGDYRRYIDSVKHRSTFVWLERALRQLYGIEQPLRADTLEIYDEAVRAAHSRADFDKDVLQNKLHVQRVILDAHWSPGSDNGCPQFFSPALRIDSFLAGQSPLARDCDGRNCTVLYGERFSDFDSYIDSMNGIVEAAVRCGAVALKCASAYSRGIDFEFVDEKRARAAFEKKNPTESDIKAFQDHIFWRLCDAAARLDVPFQVHTGLATLRRTNANQLAAAIAGNPDTRFVILHCGYPWVEDVIGLAHVFGKNVFPDITWVPLLSADAAAELLGRLIDGGSTRNICWGDDTWTAEEFAGALLAARHVIAAALTKKVEAGFLSIGDAKTIAQSILCDNAKSIYFKQD